MLKKTGYLEHEQRDMNPASPTYNQVRWVRGAISPACPNETGAGITMAVIQSQEIAEYLPVPNCPDERNVLRILPKGFKTAPSQLEADYLARQYFESTNAAHVQQYGSCD